MFDYLRRFLIAIAVATTIGILFLSATDTFAQTNEYERVNFIWPTYGLITDTFGTRNGQHYGIDIAAPRGTAVISVSDGIVTKSYYSSTYGNVVFIEHNQDFETVYAHLHERLVKEGDTVYEGEQVGTIGNTGRSSGDHLHFEVHDGKWTNTKNNAIDPFLVLVNQSDENQVTSVSTTIQDRYLVRAGDTLSEIAEKSGVSVAKIKKINDLTDDVIQVGTLLKIIK